MAEIQLSKGYVALVDDEDYEWLNQWKWSYSGHGYAMRAYGGRKDQKFILMHRLITDCPKGVFVDHINMNGLDNRRSNLRLATKSQNQANSGPRADNTSGYKGVSWIANAWVAQIGHNGSRIKLGRFQNLKDALVAYNTRAEELFGEFAYQNELPE